MGRKAVHGSNSSGIGGGSRPRTAQGREIAVRRRIYATRLNGTDVRTFPRGFARPAFIERCPAREPQFPELAPEASLRNSGPDKWMCPKAAARCGGRKRMWP